MIENNNTSIEHDPIRASNEDFLRLLDIENEKENIDYINKQISKETEKIPKVEKLDDPDNFDMLAYVEERDPEAHASIMLSANNDGYEDINSMVNAAQDTAIEDLRSMADANMFKEQYTEEHSKEMDEFGLVSDTEVDSLNSKETITSIDGKHVVSPPSNIKAPKVHKVQLAILGTEKKKADKYYGISGLLYQGAELLWEAGKDIISDEIINGLQNNIELMGTSSTSFEENYAVKRQALINIAKLIGTSKFHQKAYDRLNEVFPDINFENTEEAYKLLRFKVQSAAQELSLIHI